MGKHSGKCSLCDQLTTGAEPHINVSLKNQRENDTESHIQPTPPQVIPLGARLLVHVVAHSLSLTVVSLLDASAASSQSSVEKHNEHK